MPEAKPANRVFLLAAVIVGVLATGVTFAVLQTQASEDRTPKVPILVAKHDIRPAQVIDPEKDLEEVEVAKTLVKFYSRCVPAREKGNTKGLRTNRTILAGTPLFQADLLASAANLELAGQDRALAISVRGANALAGLLAPGDFVKLLVTRPVMPTAPTAPAASQPAEGGTGDVQFALPGDRTANWRTVALVGGKAFRVLATGSRLRSRQQITAADQYEAGIDGDTQQTVTLQVTDEDARQILEQTGGGLYQVTLLMCPAPAAAKVGQ